MPEIDHRRAPRPGVAISPHRPLVERSESDQRDRLAVQLLEQIECCLLEIRIEFSGPDAVQPMMFDIVVVHAGFGVSDIEQRDENSGAVPSATRRDRLTQEGALVLELDPVTFAETEIEQIPIPGNPVASARSSCVNALLGPTKGSIRSSSTEALQKTCW